MNEPPASPAPKRQLPKAPNSPFFAPSTPRNVVSVVSTPGGSSRIVKKTGGDHVKENKSSVFSASSNLINAIVGAGIVGIPFAIKETGLVAGIVLVILCAALTEKSLRVLIATAKHADCPSYETLFESIFGKMGFYFISVNMLIMAYGGCLSYLTIIKDTLPVLLGVANDDYGMKRAILTISSMAVILPISMQRDIADLAKTSKISVLFQCSMVIVVIIFCPVSETLDDHGGLFEVASNSVLNGATVFIGIGVLSFAFVCQHGAFIIAGSLENPTKERWGKATGRALSVCVVLELAIGVAGYLAFLDDTDGDILNNFLGMSGTREHGAHVARGLLCVTMFFVYPVDSFVCRHVLVVLLFRGRRAHEGEDSAVLSRRDRRVAMTVIIYLSALLPALAVDDVGTVLAITGTIAGSCLSYIGPGLIYLAVYGKEFSEKVRISWGRGGTAENSDVELACKDESTKLLQNSGSPEDGGAGDSQVLPFPGFIREILYYVLLMPLWCYIANIGETRVKEFKEEKALKSPHISRIGKVAPPKRGEERIGASGMPRSSSSPDMPTKGPKMLPYGSVVGGNKGIAAALMAKKKSEENGNVATVDEEGSVDVDEPPTWGDFATAIFFIIFGMVALVAGLVSIIVAGPEKQSE